MRPWGPNIPQKFNVNNIMHRGGQILYTVLRAEHELQCKFGSELNCVRQILEFLDVH